MAALKAKEDAIKVSMKNTNIEQTKVLLDEASASGEKPSRASSNIERKFPALGFLNRTSVAQSPVTDESAIGRKSSADTSAKKKKLFGRL